MIPDRWRPSYHVDFKHEGAARLKLVFLSIAFVTCVTGALAGTMYALIVALCLLALFPCLIRLAAAEEHIQFWEYFVGTTTRWAAINDLMPPVTRFDEIKAREAEIREWLGQNVREKCYRVSMDGTVIFLWKDDAMLFKVSWGEL